MHWVPYCSKDIFQAHHHQLAVCQTSCSFFILLASSLSLKANGDFVILLSLLHSSATSVPVLNVTLAVAGHTYQPLLANNTLTLRVGWKPGPWLLLLQESWEVGDEVHGWALLELESSSNHPFSPFPSHPSPPLIPRELTRATTHVAVARGFVKDSGWGALRCLFLYVIGYLRHAIGCLQGSCSL